VLYQRHDAFPMCYFADEHGVALTDRLERIWDDLPVDATDAAALFSDAIGKIQDEEERNEDAAREFSGLVQQSNSATLKALDRLRDQLRTPNFAQLGVLRPMPKKTIVLRIRIPAKYRLDQEVLGRFEAELVRQLKIQLRLLNGQRLDNWFVKLDLFDAPKELVQWSNWLNLRPTGYLAKLYAELLRRAQDERDRTSMHGNAAARRQRLDRAVILIRKAQSPDEVATLLGSLDAEWARDLVGRSNSQTDWKTKHRGAIEKLFTQHVTIGTTWRGLADPLNWRSLAPLHNPDQVAGGERHLPSSPQNIADYVGPNPVNSAIGRAWGLPKTEYDEELDMRVPVEPNRMQQLRAEMLHEYPPVCWALFTTRFSFELHLL
jgi:hypothetical protein